MIKLTVTILKPSGERKEWTGYCKNKMHARHLFGKMRIKYPLYDLVYKIEEIK